MPDRRPPRPGRVPAPRGPAGPRPVSEVRSDLAIDSLKLPPEQHAPAPPQSTAPEGVEVERSADGGIEICRVRVVTEAGEHLVGKPRGTYVTLDAPRLRERDTTVQERMARLLGTQLRELLPEGPDRPVLVVGLGNWNATPDALGPRVVENLLVTRHLGEQVPANLSGSLRPVAAIAPGVLGLTGIETGDVIRGVVDRIRPDAVIAVDALATRSIERILRTVQIADTGIRPGSGVGNHRAGIDRGSLGVPVVAVGVPTVVSAATIAGDAIELLVQRLEEASPSAAAALRELLGDGRRDVISEVLSPGVGDLMVTPNDMDSRVLVSASPGGAEHWKRLSR